MRTIVARNAHASEVGTRFDSRSRDLATPQATTAATRPLYGTVPRGLKVSSGARDLFAMLDSHQLNKASVRVSVATLGADIGKSPRQTQRYLQELRDAGYLTVTITGRSSRYVLHNPVRQRSDKHGVSATTDLSSPHRSSPEEYTSCATDPESTAAAIAGPGNDAKPQQERTAETQPLSRQQAAPYLAAIETQTGNRVDYQDRLAPVLAAIAVHSSPAQFADNLRQRWAPMANRDLRNPAGYIASILLPHMASTAGKAAPPVIARGAQTLVPNGGSQDYLSRHPDSGTACHHGYPIETAATSCALCKRQPQPGPAAPSSMSAPVPISAARAAEIRTDLAARPRQRD